MVVVVVVVCAMPEKGPMILTEKVTLQRYESDNTVNNISPRLHIPGLKPHEGDDVYVEIYEFNQSRNIDLVDEYVTSVYSDRPAISILSDVIKNNGLMPGQPLRVKIYELDEQQETSKETAERTLKEQPDQELLEDIHAKITDLHDAYTEIND